MSEPLPNVRLMSCRALPLALPLRRGTRPVSSRIAPRAHVHRPRARWASTTLERPLARRSRLVAVAAGTSAIQWSSSVDASVCLDVPLDLYTLLGAPKAALPDADAVLQAMVARLARDEEDESGFTAAAVATSQGLVEQAAACLSNRESRKAYDASLLRNPRATTPVRVPPRPSHVHRRRIATVGSDIRGHRCGSLTTTGAISPTLAGHMLHRIAWCMYDSEFALRPLDTRGGGPSQLSRRASRGTALDIRYIGVATLLSLPQAVDRRCLTTGRPVRRWLTADAFSRSSLRRCRSRRCPAYCCCCRYETCVLASLVSSHLTHARRLQGECVSAGKWVCRSARGASDVRGCGELLARACYLLPPPRRAQNRCFC
jgi:hypothetical protein